MKREREGGIEGGREAEAPGGQIRLRPRPQSATRHGVEVEGGALTAATGSKSASQGAVIAVLQRSRRWGGPLGGEAGRLELQAAWAADQPGAWILAYIHGGVGVLAVDIRRFDWSGRD